MPFGEVTTTVRAPPGRAPSDVNLDQGVFTQRLVDAGGMFPDSLSSLTPSTLDVDAINGDVVSLTSLIPEHIDFKVFDPVTGQLRVAIGSTSIDLLTDTGISTTIQFVNLAGSVLANIIYSSLNDVSVQGLGTAGASLVSLAVSNTYSGEYAMCEVIHGQWTMLAYQLGASLARVEVNLNHTTGINGPRCDITNTQSSGVFEIWTFVNGNLVGGQNVSDKFIGTAFANFTASFGIRYTAAGAASIGGLYVMFRALRMTINGGGTTPAGVALAAGTHTNVAGVSLSSIAQGGAFYNTSATAAGNVVSTDTGTFS